MTTSSESPATAAWPVQLQQLITHVFNLDELRELCLRLGIDYEELGEGSKSARVLALLRYVNQSGQLNGLLEHGRTLRPQQPWDVIAKAASQQPELFPQHIAAQADEMQRILVDLRDSIGNIESTLVSAAEAKDIEQLPPEPGVPPYRGLQYFDEEDAEHFLGRELLTAKVIGRMHHSPFLAVIGASGSGKSSLVRAGVVPALRRGTRLADDSLPPADSSRWTILTMTPTAHPLDALAATLLLDTTSIAAVSTLQSELASNAQALAIAARQSLARQGSKHLLLVIDQFEEIFTLCRSAEERQAFINNLVYAVSDAQSPSLPVSQSQPITIIVTLRADFYAQYAQYDHLRQLISQHQEYIGAMSREELFRVIVLPAAKGNWRIQEGLVEVMLDDAGDEPGALPLLSHALLETWTRRRGRTMTLSGYREAGGVRGAIAKTAETIFQQRLTAEQQRVARMIFVRLTELGEATGDTPDTRRPVQFSELITRTTDTQLLDAVLGILTDARLIMTDITPGGEAQIVEIAHEALIREWPTLRQWLDQDREMLVRQRQLTDDVNEWLKLDRDPGMLYRGLRLQQALEWSAGPPEPLSLVEQEFLEASQAAAEEEAQKARRLAQAARNQRILAALSVLLLAAVIFAALYANGVFNPPPPPEQMDGDFNIAVAEFAILDENGRLTNDENEAGLALAGRVAQNLNSEFGSNPNTNILVWNDGPELLDQHHTTIGVVVDEGDTAATGEEVETAESAAERLNADIVVYGLVEPAADFANLTLKFYLHPQFGADFTNMVGNYAFPVEIPLFDITRPREEVWRLLDPQARSLAWLAYGLRQEVLGDPQAALQAFERAASFAPDSDINHYFIGQEYIFLAQQGNEGDEAYLGEAEAALLEALRLNPENARAQIGLGSVHFIEAQQLFNEVRAADFAGDTAEGYAAVRDLAQQALEAYTVVATQPEQVEQYGVPVNSIGRLGQGYSLRLLADVAYRLGDTESALRRLDDAIDTLETAVAPLEEARDYRLLAQLYQTAGTVYELQGFILELQEPVAAAAAQQLALDNYEQCIGLGENFPFDTFMMNRIINDLCMPYADRVRMALESGS